MSSFFERLAQRTLGTAALASPRTPGLFAAPADPVPQAPMTQHAARPASLTPAPGEVPAARLAVPPAADPQPSARSSAVRADRPPARPGEHVAASRVEASSHPTGTSAPATTRDHVATTPGFTASARRGRAPGTPGSVHAPSREPVSLEPLVPPADGAPPPAARERWPRDTPESAAGPGKPLPRHAAPDGPTVSITIGAIEVRTPVSAPRVERVTAPQPRPGLSLHDYLRRGRGSP